MRIRVAILLLGVAIGCLIGSLIRPRADADVPSPYRASPKYVVSETRERELIARFKQLKVGMAQAEVDATMGPADRRQSVHVGQARGDVTSFSYYLKSWSGLRENTMANTRDSLLIVMFAGEEKRVERLMTNEVSGLPESAPPLPK